MVAAAEPAYAAPAPQGFGAAANSFLGYLPGLVLAMACLRIAEVAQGVQSGVAWSVSHGADEIAYAKAIGRTVWLGVETLPNELKKVSFEHLREADMERELGLAQRSFEDNKAFGGFVIHHYSQYQRWLKGVK